MEGGSTIYVSTDEFKNLAPTQVLILRQLDLIMRVDSSHFRPEMVPVVIADKWHNISIENSAQAWRNP